jgi:hypothetical protein
MVIECKALDGDRANPRRAWRVPINRAQLRTYLRLGLDLTYLLPARPRSSAAPWVRNCTQDPSPSGFCRACFASTAGNARRWSGRSVLWKNVPPHLRLQPWFNHWAWCVRASDLDKHLTTTGLTFSVRAADINMEAIPGADRLCHVLADAEAAAAGVGGDRALPFIGSAEEALETVAILSNLEAVATDEDDTQPLLVTF